MPITNIPVAMSAEFELMIKAVNLSITERWQNWAVIRAEIEDTVDNFTRDEDRMQLTRDLIRTGWLTAADMFMATRHAELARAIWTEYRPDVEQDDVEEWKRLIITGA